MVREQSERCDSKVSEQSAISVVDTFLISFIFRTKERNLSPTLGRAQRNSLPMDDGTAFDLTAAPSSLLPPTTVVTHIFLSMKSRRQK